MMSIGPSQSTAMVILSLFLVSHPLVRADTIGPNYPSLQDTNYQPNLVIVTVILGVMFVVTVLILVFARLCRGGAESPAEPVRDGPALLGSAARFSGLSKAAIESLPLFRFSSLTGSRDGLECSVCLSRFDGVEVLRVLPKCRHAFHIACIDHWLEKHATCPLCRGRVSAEDLKLIAHSTSMRFLRRSSNNGGERSEPGEVEVFVEREESRRGSSRFSLLGNSFRKVEREGDREELLVENDVESGRREFHRHNHKMVVSDFAFTNRWSDVSSSDLVFLSSEMLRDSSSGRFSSTGTKDEFGAFHTSEFSNPVRDFGSSSRPMMNSGGQRSVSEITGLSRYRNSDVKRKIIENNVKDDRIREVWLPIAKRTVQCFANRERPQLAQNV